MSTHLNGPGSAAALVVLLACSGTNEDTAWVDADTVPSEEAPAGGGADSQLQGLPYSESEVLALLAEAGLVPRTYEELVQEYETKLNSVLSATEESKIREALRGSADELRLQGRVVFVGDVVLDADQILNDSKEVDKAQVCINTGSVEGCDSYQTSSYTQNDGDGNPQTLSFRRPDVQRTTYIVVANGATTFLNALNQETARIEELNPTGDCLNSGSLRPIKQSDYNALSGIERAMGFTVLGSVGSGVCGSANRGCASLPGNINVLVTLPNTVELRTGFGQSGTRILGMNSDLLPTDNDEFRSTLRHELLHLIGRSHRDFDGSQRLALIPGTLANAASLMEIDGDAFRTKDFSADDILGIKTLYSDHPDRANDGCAWTSSFRSFTALP